MQNLVEQLSESEAHRFSNWPNRSIPPIAAGVYAVYDSSDKFLYVGMAGASLSPPRTKELSQIPGRKSGLYDRLNSHASGYRSGDRFNIYICDLFVLETLTKAQIENITNRRISLDSLNKDYIRKELSYRYILTEYNVVRKLEDYIQRNGLNRVLPTINPKR
jgi:hypothetical protein